MDVDSFNTVYNGLSLFEKRVLQFISIMYETSSTNKIDIILNSSNIKETDGYHHYDQKLSVVLSKLETLQLIKKKSNIFYKCDDFVKNMAAIKAVQEGVVRDITSAVQKQTTLRTNAFRPEPDLIIRDIRIGFYTNDAEQAISRYKLLLFGYSGYSHSERVFHKICNTPFHPSWFQSLPLILQATALDEIIEDAIIGLQPLDQFMEILIPYKDAPKSDDNRHMRFLLATVFIFQGKLTEASEVIDKEGEYFFAHCVRGCLQLLKGNIEESITEYETSLKLLQRNNRKRNIFFKNIIGLFFFIAKLKKGDLEFIYRYADIINKMTSYRYRTSMQMILHICNLLEGKSVTPNKLLFSLVEKRSKDIIAEILCYLVFHYVDTSIPQSNLSEFYNTYRMASSNGYPIIAMDMANLLSIFMKDRPGLVEFVQETRQQTGAIGFISNLNLKSTAWERSLDSIIDMFHIGNDVTAKRKARLIWHLKIDTHRNSCIITPKEQKALKDGTWSKGKNIALKRLHKAKTENDLPLTTHDMRICSTLLADRYYGYEFDTKKALIEMIDHPLLFLEDSVENRVEIKRGTPKLIVDKSKDGYILKLSHFKQGEDIVIVKEAANKYKVVEIKEDHKKLYTLLGTNGLHVPKDAKDKVLKAISNLSTIVQVHSSMDISVENAQAVISDTRPHIRLLPFREGLKAEMTIRPFGDDGPYMKPGIGGVNLLVEISGKPYQTHRDFEQEKRNASKVINTCHVLLEEEQIDWEWAINDPEMCLQLLVELKEVGEEIAMEWPEGQRYSVTNEVSFDSLRLSLRRETDWFSISGEVTLDESTVMDIKKVLDLLDSGKGRFIKLDEGKYMVLTRQLKKRLEDMKAYSERHSKGVHMHPLAALALQDFFEDIKSIDVDGGWREYVKRLTDIDDLNPVVPSTLQAELRDYQVEGFKWLSRLAHWGVGACLADDMGLGKTLEALAVILERAGEGASLVVIPTSVQSNWQKEAKRFAPTLNVVIFGGKDRKQILEDLRPNDLVLCTYGLLQSEVDLLGEVNWQTIVLDEAQAIKNFATKRSQAAMKLKGGFKIITTGTPIENHLGELWNLFNFINPGLLGSLDRFNRRFAIPIEKYNNSDARKRLKRLVQPFILRRTKSQVLEELPLRTEIVLEVEMSEIEASFYEALRQKAIERIEMSEVQSGQKLISILAELMKLRRACCNPKLVQDVDIPSSKLTLFSEVLEELLDNKHKVLVFSQFVDHLRIIRQYLDSKSISYQYLDGSTPIKERTRAVDDFQSGKGDVFLISIKAGGFGLNLTAADYVIHMDPWWNPAVEDQASDRAHRIGQKRPVTIYKLITKNTIEEKIVKLHENKKELANSLLYGTELSSKVSAEELIALIKEM